MCHSHDHESSESCIRKIIMKLTQQNNIVLSNISLKTSQVVEYVSNKFLINAGDVHTSGKIVNLKWNYIL